MRWLGASGVNSMGVLVRLLQADGGLWSTFLGSSYFLHFLKDSFPVYRILGLQFFPHRTLNLSTLCLLASMISNGKPVVNLIEDGFHIVSYFFLTVFKIFSLYFVFDN